MSPPGHRKGDEALFQALACGATVENAARKFPKRGHAMLPVASLFLRVAVNRAPTGATAAQEPSSASPEVQRLLDRLEKLEQRNDELEKTVRQLQAENQVSQEKSGCAGGETSMEGRFR
jgi:hypothetical protein